MQINIAFYLVKPIKITLNLMKIVCVVNSMLLKPISVNFF